MCIYICMCVHVYMFKRFTWISFHYGPFHLYHCSCNLKTLSSSPASMKSVVFLRNPRKFPIVQWSCESRGRGILLLSPESLPQLLYEKASAVNVWEKGCGPNQTPLHPFQDMKEDAGVRPLKPKLKHWVESPAHVHWRENNGYCTSKDKYLLPVSMSEFNFFITVRRCVFRCMFIFVWHKFPSLPCQEPLVSLSLIYRKWANIAMPPFGNVESITYVYVEARVVYGLYLCLSWHTCDNRNDGKIRMSATGSWGPRVNDRGN